MRRCRTGKKYSIVSVFLLVLILIVGYLQKQTPLMHDRVVDVLDGDSLVIFQDGNSRQIRLYAIDCPERSQAFGSQACDFTRILVKGKAVTFRLHDQDRYGRWVSEVFLEDGRSLNHELVKAGFAWWYRHHAQNNRILERLEIEARAGKRGLWAGANPIPPWEFRRRRREVE